MYDKMGQYFLAANNARIHYQEAGSGKTLVLVHGFTFDMRCWDDQFDEFARVCHVIRFDLRGHGKTDPPLDVPYTYHDDLKGLLDHTGTLSVCVVGHSLGGLIAINFALNYPMLTNALILVDPGLSGFEWSDEVGGWMEATWKAGRESGVAAAREIWLSGQPWKPALESPTVSPRVIEMITAYSGWHWVHDDPHRGPEVPTIQRLGEIKCPTLLLVGGRNPADYHRVADVIENEVAGVRRVLLPGVGHAPNMEAPDAFNEEVLRFLADMKYAG